MEQIAPTSCQDKLQQCNFWSKNKKNSYKTALKNIYGTFGEVWIWSTYYVHAQSCLTLCNPHGLLRSFQTCEHWSSIIAGLALKWPFIPQGWLSSQSKPGERGQLDVFPRGKMGNPSLKSFYIQIHSDIQIHSGIIRVSQNCNVKRNHLGLMLTCRFLFLNLERGWSSELSSGSQQSRCCASPNHTMMRRPQSLLWKTWGSRALPD